MSLGPAGGSFACGPEQTILRAGLEAGLVMPYECASGSCGSCKARLIEGEVDALWPDATGLSERDRRKGDRVLCCQVRPRSDCVIQVRAPDGNPEPIPGTFDATVTALDRLTHDVLSIECQARDERPFLPGQFVLVTLPDGARRAYSMANLSDGAGALALIAKEKPGGAASRYLFSGLAVGDRIALEGPYGRAYLRTPIERDIVCVAGGSGLAPMLSVMRGALASGTARPVHLFFGVNTVRDLFMTEQLTALAESDARLAVTFAVRDEAAALPPDAVTGLVGDVMMDAVPDLSATDLYMAGPPAMCDALLRALIPTQRIPADHVYFDRFY